MKTKAVIFLLIISIIFFIFSVGFAEFFILEPYSSSFFIPNTNRLIPPGKIIEPSPVVFTRLKTLSDIKNDLILDEVDFIEANLGEMKMRFYKSGEVLKEYSILTKGKEDSWSETPAGLFKIIKKHRIAYSILGDVYMPFHMTFIGEYSIHGEPYEQDGTPLDRLFTSGCLNIKDEDAKELFNLTEVGLPLLVLEDDFENDDFQYSIPETISPDPEVSAESYLAADLKNNNIFLEKEADLLFPLDSITDLMTAIVASENSVLAFDKKKTTQVHISENSLLPQGATPGIEIDKTYTYFELLYPLLIASSNDAAESLALRFGRAKFVQMMNDRASSIGMINTKFIDAYGGSEVNVSSAEELFYLARYLLNNRYWLLEISRGKVFENFGEISFKNLENTNPFNDSADYIGGQVSEGTNGLKNSVLLFNFKINNEIRPIAIILLASENVEKDTSEIINWIRLNFEHNNE